MTVRMPHQSLEVSLYKPVHQFGTEAQASVNFAFEECEVNHIARHSSFSLQSTYLADAFLCIQGQAFIDNIIAEVYWTSLV